GQKIKIGSTHAGTVVTIHTHDNLLRVHLGRPGPHRDRPHRHQTSHPVQSPQARTTPTTPPPTRQAPHMNRDNLTARLARSPGPTARSGRLLLISRHGRDV